ncbi:MAG: hypothetical protein H6632_20680 [Anaerolineales bacterium]|nr:hypothetical protein [Anaerolineales bacterium]
MISKPNRVEIDHHTIKLIIGIFAISLATLTSLFSETPLTSISASYYADGWSRNIFVGFLFAISAFLLAYNGKSAPEFVLSKLAAVAAIGVAMFPCKCGSHTEIIPYIHYISAAVMFLILVGFCYIFFQRAYAKGHTQAKFRASIYALCGITILTSIAIIVVNTLLADVISLKISRLIFFCEAAGLIAFGVAWLSASRCLPLITSEKERISLLPASDKEAKPDADKNTSYVTTGQWQS